MCYSWLWSLSSHPTRCDKTSALTEPESSPAAPAAVDAGLKPELLCNLKSVCVITLPFLSPSSSPVVSAMMANREGKALSDTGIADRPVRARTGPLGIREADGQEGRMTGSLPCSRAVGNGHDKGRIRPPRVAEALA